jgi:hypothetical protein
MHSIIFHVKWGGLMAKELISIIRVQGSNLKLNDIIVVNNGMLTMCYLHNYVI